MTQDQRNDLVARIIVLRSCSGKTVKDLADLAGVDRSTWYRVEQGEETTVATLRAMLDVMGADLEVVMRTRQPAKRPSPTGKE